jgi:hypothetical protein
MTEISRSAHFSPRALALIAGVSLLGLAVLSVFAYFGVVGTLVVQGDQAATLTNLIASDGLFRIGIAAFLMVIVLDVIVAWSLYLLLKPANPGLALLMAAFRLAFAVLFLAAVANLLDVAQLLSDPSYLRSIGPATLGAQITSTIASFENMWDLGLALFGLHLVALAGLLFRTSLASRLLGAVVVVAGVGYLFDTFGEVLVPGYSLNVSGFTFEGESLVNLWHLWTGDTDRVSPELGGQIKDRGDPLIGQPEAAAA